MRCRSGYNVTSSEGGAKVSVDADLTISGAAAQFGRTGLINQISQRLIQEFVECLEAKLAAATPTEAAAIEAEDVKGFSLMISTLFSKIAGALKKLRGRD